MPLFSSLLLLRRKPSDAEPTSHHIFAPPNPIHDPSPSTTTTTIFTRPPIVPAGLKSLYEHDQPRDVMDEEGRCRYHHQPSNTNANPPVFHHLTPANRVLNNGHHNPCRMVRSFSWSSFSSPIAFSPATSSLPSLSSLGSSFATSSSLSSSTSSSSSSSSSRPPSAVGVLNGAMDLDCLAEPMVITNGNAGGYEPASASSGEDDSHQGCREDECEPNDDDDNAGCCWARYGPREDWFRMPPPLPSLAMFDPNSPRRVQDARVLKRSYEPDGRLILRQVCVNQDRGFLKARRENGRLVLSLMHFVDTARPDHHQEREETTAPPVSGADCYEEAVADAQEDHPEVPETATFDGCHEYYCSDDADVDLLDNADGDDNDPGYSATQDDGGPCRYPGGLFPLVEDPQPRSYSDTAVGHHPWPVHLSSMAALSSSMPEMTTAALAKGCFPNGKARSDLLKQLAAPRVHLVRS